MQCSDERRLVDRAVSGRILLDHANFGQSLVGRPEHAMFGQRLMDRAVSVVKLSGACNVRTKSGQNRSIAEKSSGPCKSCGSFTHRYTYRSDVFGSMQCFVDRLSEHAPLGQNRTPIS